MTGNTGMMGGMLKITVDIKTYQWCIIWYSLAIINFLSKLTAVENKMLFIGWKRNFTENLSKSFSSCSKAAMIATLQKIHTNNEKKKESKETSSCFKSKVSNQSKLKNTRQRS